MEGGKAISHRLVGALLLVKPEPQRLLSALCKGHSQGFVFSFKGPGTACCRPGDERGPSSEGQPERIQQKKEKGRKI